MNKVYVKQNPGYAQVIYFKTFMKNSLQNSRTSVEQISKSISRNEKIQYLRIALSLQHIGIDDKMADRIIETYENVLRLGGNFKISDAVEIEFAIERKYSEKKIKNRIT